LHGTFRIAVDGAKPRHSAENFSYWPRPGFAFRRLTSSAMVTFYLIVGQTKNVNYWRKDASGESFENKEGNKPLGCPASYSLTGDGFLFCSEKLA